MVVLRLAMSSAHGCCQTDFCLASVCMISSRLFICINIFLNFVQQAPVFLNAVATRLDEHAVIFRGTRFTQSPAHHRAKAVVKVS